MKKQVVCNIKVFNRESKTSWEHRRVPENHVGILEMSPNLEVTVIKKFFIFSEKNNESKKNTSRS